jgi:hypothetical protein
MRLAERKVARVFIGMLDPNPDIRGMGQMLLSNADIETQFFPRDLMKEVEELNRDFIREQTRKKKSTGDPQLEMILSSKGKPVTVTNRRSNTYWGGDTVIVDCNAVFVTLKNAGSSEAQLFPLTQVDVSFDHTNNRLSIDLNRH